MRLLKWWAACLCVVWAQIVGAQDEPQIDLDAPLPPDITRDFSATYGFPVVENRVLMIDDSFEAIKPFNRQITPFGIPLTYQLINLRKPWNSYLALRNYAAGAQTPVDSMAVLEPIIDTQGRAFILSQIGMPPLVGVSTHQTFANHVFGKGDEFDIEAFNRLVKNLYGSAPPLAGTVQIMNLKTIEFGAYGFGPEAIPIFGISDLATSFGGVEAEVIFPDHALRAQISIAEEDAKPKVRQLPRQGTYLPSRPNGAFFEGFSRSGTLAVVGRLVIPTDPRDPVRYYIDQVALYTDSTMTKPVPGIGLQQVFLDIGTPRRTEAESNRLQAIRDETAWQARETAYILEHIKRQQRLAKYAADALARDVAAAKAAYALLRAEKEKLLEGLTLDVLGVSLGMSERQVLAGLRALRGGYEITYADRSSIGEFASGCTNGIYAGGISARTSFDVQTGSVIEAENRRASEHAAQFHLEENPHCRADLQAFGPRIVASVKLGFIGRDQIEVIFAPSGPRENRVVAVRRSIEWDLSAVPVVKSLRSKHGETRLVDPSGTQVWTKDPDLFIEGQTASSSRTACFIRPFGDVVRSNDNVANVTRDCGAFLAAIQSETSARVLLLDSTHIVERRSARQTMTLNRADMTAEAVEF